MRTVVLIFFLSNPVFSQDLSFQQIKNWSNSDYFAETVFDNYWSISESSKFYVKATHSELGEIFYYKEDTPTNVANTFEVRLLNKDLMMSIRREIISECGFLRRFKIEENIYSFYDCENKKYFGIIGIGIITDNSGGEIYSILNKESFID
tara:strand:+ start:3044 stop:3493 length:450 start_codon:yes stop_codon:yes gene_type:complete